MVDIVALLFSELYYLYLTIYRGIGHKDFRKLKDNFDSYFSYFFKTFYYLILIYINNYNLLIHLK